MFRWVCVNIPQYHSGHTGIFKSSGLIRVVLSSERMADFIMSFKVKTMTKSKDRKMTGEKRTKLNLHDRPYSLAPDFWYLGNNQTSIIMKIMARSRRFCYFEVDYILLFYNIHCWILSCRSASLFFAIITTFSLSLSLSLYHYLFFYLYRWFKYINDKGALPSN